MNFTKPKFIVVLVVVLLVLLALTKNRSFLLATGLSSDIEDVKVSDTDYIKVSNTEAVKVRDDKGAKVKDMFELYSRLYQVNDVNCSAVLEGDKDSVRVSVSFTNVRFGLKMNTNVLYCSE